MAVAFGANAATPGLGTAGGPGSTGEATAGLEAPLGLLVWLNATGFEEGGEDSGALEGSGGLADVVVPQRPHVICRAHLA